MAVMIKCKMCGGDLLLAEGSTIATCEYCGTQQTVPAADNEKKMSLFVRANKLRFACDFDKAAGIYESIAAEFPDEAEGYWGLVLCKYGIEYVDDPATGKKIPTCHRSSFDSVMEDSNFEQALENADVVSRKVYREEAKQIEEIRKGIIEVSAKEEPYDIFICYKETAEDGQRTVDSVLAQDIYDALTDKGYRTFFARITLEDKLGQEYEPYIFAALNSAKVMLSIGTDYEHFNAVWVKNEWSRFLKLMEKDKNKHLIPCFKGIDAYDMPKEFNKLQAQDLGKVGAVQDLLRGIDKLIAVKPAAVQPTPQVQTEDLNRSFIYNSALQKGEEKKISSIKQAIKKLETIADYADAQEQIQRLQEKLVSLKRKRMLRRVLACLLVIVVVGACIGINAYQDYRFKQQEYQNAQNLKEEYYNMGVEALETYKYSEAKTYFEHAGDYVDAAQYVADIENWVEQLTQFREMILAAGPYVAEDGEILSFEHWTEGTYSPADYPPVIPHTYDSLAYRVPLRTFFSDTGVFSYDAQAEEFSYTSADGSAYTLQFENNSITFHGNGHLDGRVYQHYGIYLTQKAQMFLDNGLNNIVTIVTRWARNEYLPEEYMELTEQLNAAANKNRDAQAQMAEEMFAHIGNYDEDKMDALQTASENGRLTVWSNYLQSGDYHGFYLEVSSIRWAFFCMPCYENSTLLFLEELMQEDVTLAQLADYWVTNDTDLKQKIAAIDRDKLFSLDEY